MTFAPTRTTLIALGLVCMPMIAAGVYGMFFLAGGLFYGALLFLIGAVIWGYVGTIRIVLTGDEMSFRRYWRTEWSCARGNARVVDGMGGRPALIPALIVTDRTSDTTHEILKTQFSTTDLTKIREFLLSTN